MDETLTDQDYKDIIDEIQKLSKKTEDSKIDKSVKDTLMQNASAIQDVLNSFLSKTGALTKEQYDELDEKLKKYKFDLLQAQLSRTKKFLIGGLIGFGTLIGLLFYFTRKKD